MGILAWGGVNEIEAEKFYNRNSEILFIKNLLNTLNQGTSPTIILSGVRGVGKSVLLKKIKQELENEYLTVYIDLTKNYSYQKDKLNENTLMEIFYKAIIKECNNKNLNIIMKKIKKTLETNKLKLNKIIELNGFPIPIPESETDSAKLLEFVLNLPQDIYETHKKEIKGVIIMIDEFQTIKDLGNNLNSFLWLFRSVIQTQNNVAYLFSGSVNSKDEVMEQVSGERGVFGGRTLTIKIEPFTKETTQNYLKERLPSLKLTNAGFERFYACTKGIPFYINTFANLLEKNTLLDDEKIKKSFKETISILSDHLKQDWGRLTLREQEIIVSLIESPLKRKEIGLKLGKSPNSLSRPLNRLQNEGLIAKENTEKYDICEPMLKIWLKTEKEVKGVIPYRAS
jgi:predicted AAA+ superfamily ATPase